MTEESNKEQARTSPLGDMKTTDRFPATVVQPGPTPRVHGYAIREDLAPNYDFSERLLLALTGELPTVENGKAFDVALGFLMEMPVSSAPTHAARVARVGTGGVSAVFGVGLLGLVAQAEQDVAHFEAVSTFIHEGERQPGLAPKTDAERVAVARLRAAMPWKELGPLAADIGLVPAILAVIIMCGVARREAAMLALIHGRMATTLMEGFGDGDRSFATLPIQFPQVEYVREVVR